MPDNKLENKPLRQWTIAEVIKALFGFMIIAAIIWSIASCGSDKKPEAKHSKTGAYVMSQQFVKDRLKSPGSAKFPWYSDDMVADLGGGKYIVRAYVDSQNSFGAMLRTQYVCIIKYIPDTDMWHLDDLQTQQQ